MEVGICAHVQLHDHIPAGNALRCLYAGFMLPAGAHDCMTADLLLRAAAHQESNTLLANAERCRSTSTAVTVRICRHIRTSRVHECLGVPERPTQPFESAGEDVLAERTT